ncbi:MAG: glycosyltransferase [Xanthobacteraceae bacterium]|nr:glycosyltransferase [Xanthobacteraceae bacterium]
MPTLWVDLTTSFEEQCRHPHGTMRVEAGIVDAFLRNQSNNTQFVVFFRPLNKFKTLTKAQVALVLSAPLLADPNREYLIRPRESRFRRAYKKCLRGFRRLIHGKIKQALALQGSHPPVMADTVKQLPDADIQPGDVMLFSGEHHRYGFRQLRDLRRQGCRLAFVFFDLLRVLEDDDPGWRDPDNFDVPQSDFMVREADLLMPISHFSAQELNAHLQRRRLKGPIIQVVRLAGVLKPGKDKRVNGLTPNGFILCVGDVVCRKNQLLLAKVWKKRLERRLTSLKLVIVGRLDPEARQVVEFVKADLPLSRYVIFLANIDDEELVWLYRNCRHTVFPSRLEGFGLPVIESLSFGKACISSTAQAVLEAGQGFTVALDPDDDAAWIHAIASFENDDILRAQEERIAQEYKPISWSDTRADIESAVERMLNTH